MSDSTSSPQNASSDWHEYQRWLVLIGALMVQLVLGTVYGFSALIKPIQAQFPDWSNKQVQLAFTLALLTFAIVMVPAGRLQDRKGPRTPALMGAAALLIGSLLASFVHSSSQVWLWWLSYGMVFGAGIGLAYVCPIAALSKWFPDIKGLITGVAVAGFGGGAAIFIPSVSKFLSPDAGGHSLSEFFTTHAMVCGLIVAVGALLLSNPPEGWTPPSAQPAADKPKAAKPKLAAADVAWQDMVKTPRFWLLWAMFVGSAMAGLMTIGIVKAAVKDVTIISEAQAATAASVLSICNALGRIFWGGISDRIGRDRAMLIMFGLQAVAMFTVTAGMNLGAAAACLWMALIGLNFGGNFALFPSATADAFGTRNLGVNYGWVFTAYGVGGTIGPMVAAYYKDTVKDYSPAFMVAGVLVALATLGAACYGKVAAKSAEPAES